MPLKNFPRERDQKGGGPVSLSKYRSGKHRLKVRGDIQERYRKAVEEISKLGLLSVNDLRDLLLDPSKGYNIGKARAYHFTPESRVGSILKSGLEPRINENPTSFDERSMLKQLLPEGVAHSLPRAFVEVSEGNPSGSNLPTSLRQQSLALLSIPLEEAIKRLSREDSFRILASELGRQMRYPVESNPISRIIIRKRAGVDPQRGSAPARLRSGKLEIPEWALSEIVPPRLLTRER
jgi:hypothetical protein